MQVDFTVGFDSISCPRADFCMTVETLDYSEIFGSTMWQWNGTSWMGSGLSDKSGLGQVTCSSSSFCLVTDGADRYFEWHPE